MLLPNIKNDPLFYTKTLESHNNSHKYHTDMLAHQ